MTPRNSSPVDKRKVSVAAGEKLPSVNWETLLAGISRGKTVIEYTANRIIYNQGDPADSVFYLRRGKVQHAVTSQQGKEAIVCAVLN